MAIVFKKTSVLTDTISTIALAAATGLFTALLLRRLKS